jgi:hypothetical protein
MLEIKIDVPFTKKEEKKNKKTRKYKEIIFICFLMANNF